MTIRTTLIVGYPGETEEDFEILKNWVKEMRFERLGCFAYSHEENTHAYTLEDNVPEEVKQDLEGMQTMRTLGRNMAFFLKCKEAGIKAGVKLPEVEPTVFTNFIR